MWGMVGHPVGGDIHPGNVVWLVLQNWPLHT